MARNVSLSAQQPWYVDNVAIGLAGQNNYNDLKEILKATYNLRGTELITHTQNMINLYCPAVQQQLNQSQPQPVIIVQQPSTLTTKPPKQQKQTQQQQTNSHQIEMTYNCDEWNCDCIDCSTRCNYCVENPKINGVLFLFSLGWFAVGIVLAGFCILIADDLQTYWSTYWSRGFECEYITEDMVDQFGAVSFVVLVLSIISLIFGCLILSRCADPSKTVVSIFYLVILMIHVMMTVWLLYLGGDLNSIETICYEASGYGEIENDFFTMYVLMCLLAAIVFCVIFGIVKGGYSHKIIKV